MRAPPLGGQPRSRLEDVMRHARLYMAILAVLLPFEGHAIAALPRSSMVQVEPGVQLEIVDWGGTGRPLIFLAGFGGTAHTFDGFAPQFVDRHRVIAITRRGFGASSHPVPTEANYSPERLAADVAAVIDRLGLSRPVIVGHSVAGQELTVLGLRYPGKIAGLIYLEAANAQAFYGPSSDVLYPVAGQIRQDLGQLISGQPSEAPALLDKIEAELPRLKRGLAWYRAAAKGEPDRPAGVLASPQMAVQSAIMHGARIWGPVNVPVLSIVALPPACSTDCNSERQKARAEADAAQARDFEAAQPHAVVVRIPNAGHFIWRSNEREVRTVMDRFLDSDAMK